MILRLSVAAMVKSRTATGFFQLAVTGRQAPPNLAIWRWQTLVLSVVCQSGGGGYRGSLCNKGHAWMKDVGALARWARVGRAPLFVDM